MLPFISNKKGLENFVEIGSRNALDAIFLSKVLKASGIAFECVPENVQLRLKNLEIAGVDNISVDNRCLSDISQSIIFNAINTKIYDNRGAGSIFKLDFGSRPEGDPDQNLTEIQQSIQVETIRFDETGYMAPHSIFMDVQGAELLVLKGFGEKLNQVTNIVLETSLHPTYANAADYWEICEFLVGHGFRYVVSNKYGTKEPPITRPSYYEGEFDCLFSKT